MPFSGERQPFEGAGADTVPNQNVLLARVRGGTAESHITDLAGLRAPPIQQWGTVEHILQQDCSPCHSTTARPWIRPTFF